MGNHESASPQHNECFSIPAGFREIWKMYRSSSTRSYQHNNNNDDTKNMQQSKEEASSVDVNGVRQKIHEIKRHRRHHKARHVHDRESDGIHVGKVKLASSKDSINHKHNPASRPIYCDDPTILDSSSPKYHDNDTTTRFGCFKSFLTATTTPTGMPASPKQSKPHPLKPTSSRTRSFLRAAAAAAQPTAASGNNHKKTKKPIERTQSESAAQWASKRPATEGRGSRIRRASSVGAGPQRTKSFNAAVSNGRGSGRRSVDGSPSAASSGSLYGRSSSMRSSNYNGRHVIMFSSSSGMLKPPSIEQVLECTLEELCFGCVKKMRVTRDVIASNGRITQEEELLKINVKPGWKGGTKITFPGKLETDRPDEYAADVVFTVTEKPHPIFQREEDDLMMEKNISLVDALAGFMLTVPLLGGGRENMISMAVDDVIYPGFIKVITGQGMPNQKLPQRRGDLKIKFDVVFPSVLSLDQRSEIFEILNNGSVCMALG